MDPSPIAVPHAALAEVCARFGVTRLEVFGSQARGDARPDSDLDLLVEFDPSVLVGFVHLGRLKAEFESLFGRDVDLVPRTALQPAIRDQVFADARLLFTVNPGDEEGVAAT